MRLTIYHKTHYRFDDEVTYGLQQLRKTPKTSHQQYVISWQTKVEGGRKELSFEDHHNNLVELISFDRNATEVTVSSQGDVELEDTRGIVGRHLGPSPLWLYGKATPRTQAKAGVKSLLKKLDSKDRGLETMHALSALIRETIKFRVGSSQPHWTAEDSITAGEGVCQDHTHIFLACARALGVEARYVSGYLMLNDRIVQDAMHAWAEAHIEGLGWVGFDISNGISPDTRYVRVATGLDYMDAAPISGTRIGGSGERLDVQIEVTQQ
ncbi:transglutaminase family protein [Roseovarius aestuariivivens]|uniref:transglutaminase family protein n=1 Tax=Roseovarius aestuariivivens TaxID=1888910 RepID=UPI001081882B|nr:transglutaminase family protein [Roseovarius aestuariivivens]